MIATDDLATWLREQIAETRREAEDWPDELTVRWHNVPSVNIQSVLARCEADTLILNGYVSLRDNPARRTDAALHLQWNVLREVVHTVGWGYRHQPGYQPVWKP